MYMEEFYRLTSWCELLMMEEQQTAKYINRLRYTIQEHVALHDMFSLDEAHNKAIKIERLQSRAPLFRHQLSIEEPAEGDGV